MHSCGPGRRGRLPGLARARVLTFSPVGLSSLLLQSCRLNGRRVCLIARFNRPPRYTTGNRIATTDSRLGRFCRPLAVLPVSPNSVSTSFLRVSFDFILAIESISVILEMSDRVANGWLEKFERGWLENRRASFRSVKLSIV